MKEGNMSGEIITVYAYGFATPLLLVFLAFVLHAAWEAISHRLATRNPSIQTVVTCRKCRHQSVSYKRRRAIAKIREHDCEARR